MSTEITVIPRQSRFAAQSSSAIGVNNFPDGTLVVADWIQQQVNLGYGYHASIGALSTPITGGGAGTILDLDQPEGILSVPSGVAVIPFRIGVHCHVPLLATDADECEILIAVDKDTVYAGDGTVTTETAFNLRMNSSNTSSCTVASAATADITDPTLDIELARRVITGDVQGTAGNTWWGDLDLVYEPKVRPILYGPCALYIYWGGTVATPGFADIQWVELSSDLATKIFP